jgi:hypothetical protein
MEVRHACIREIARIEGNKMATRTKEDWEEKPGVWKYFIYVSQFILFLGGIGFFLTIVAFLFPNTVEISGDLSTRLIILASPAVLTPFLIPKRTTKRVAPFLWAFYGGVAVGFFAWIILTLVHACS